MKLSLNKIINMIELMVIFQIGNVDYLVGNHFYTASIKKEEKADSIHYEVRLHDDILIKKFGIHHDYYLTEDEKVNFRLGGISDIMDLHIPMLKAIDKDYSKSKKS